MKPRCDDPFSFFQTSIVFSGIQRKIGESEFLPEMFCSEVPSSGKSFSTNSLPEISIGVITHNY